MVHSSALRKKEHFTDSCGCLKRKRLAKTSTTHGLTGTGIVELFDRAKGRAKRKGLPFDIGVEDIVIPDRCPYLGTKLSRGLRRQTANSPSLDRIDPSLGYVKGNIEVISYRANAIKHNASFEEFERMYLNWKTKLKGS